MRIELIVLCELSGNLIIGRDSALKYSTRTAHKTTRPAGAHS